MNSINKNINSFFILFCLTLALVFSACGGSSKHDNSKFAGSFTDEFNNKFVLNEDYTGTIQFAGNDKQDSITWSDGPNHQSPFATIKYNVTKIPNKTFNIFFIFYHQYEYNIKDYLVQ